MQSGKSQLQDRGKHVNGTCNGRELRAEQVANESPQKLIICQTNEVDLEPRRPILWRLALRNLPGEGHASSKWAP